MRAKAGRSETHEQAGAAAGGREMPQEGREVVGSQVTQGVWTTAGGGFISHPARRAAPGGS